MSWCQIPFMEKGFDPEKIESHYFLQNLQIFFFHGSPDFPLPGVSRSASLHSGV